jgi:glycosyltransferase involved in cell wall biosynthesis
MKVVFLARRFYPEIGGVEKHVLEISKRLIKQGHKVTVITELEKNTNVLNKHSSSESARLTGKVAGIEILRIDTGKHDWFKKFRIWKEMWRLKKHLKAADVIHCHDVFFWYLPFRFLFPTKKVFTTFHGYEGNSIPGIKAKLMHKLAEKLSGGNICVGDFLKKWYGTIPTFVTYGAVDAVNKNSKIQKSTTFKKGSIIFLGRL